ncbi:MAG TPA: alpha/beta fold hydrolase [Terriglobales bacterium]|nr:alpha/beta fold hydrolase [Terriglobales bacterium]
MRRLAWLLVLVWVAVTCAQAQTAPQPKEGDFVPRDFHFRSGEVLPELRLHYATLGTPMRDSQGTVQNAVIFLHGTTGSGENYLTPAFEKLYEPGQPLDISRWYVILPDSIGHGQSSKPSDGLHARFPHYDYYDMVEAQYRLVSQGLGLNHLRLVTGISMGGMHTWLWGELHPDFMDALMPMVSLPVEIAGRNRMWRRTAMDAIRNDSGWNNGEYQKQPANIVIAARMLALAVGGPLALQTRAPTRDAADSVLDQDSARWAHGDANDMLYQLDSSRTYNPEPDLERIQARLIAINAADDFINPPELGVMERAIKRVKKGRYVLLPLSGRGHATVGDPTVWNHYLQELLQPPHAEDPVSHRLCGNARPGGRLCTFSLRHVSLLKDTKEKRELE